MSIVGLDVSRIGSDLLTGWKQRVRTREINDVDSGEYL